MTIEFQSPVSGHRFVDAGIFLILFIIEMFQSPVSGHRFVDQIIYINLQKISMSFNPLYRVIGL